MNEKKMNTALMMNDAGQVFAVSELVFEALPVVATYFGDSRVLSLRLDNERSVILASAIDPDIGKALKSLESLQIFKLNGSSVEGGYEVPLFIREKEHA